MQEVICVECEQAAATPVRARAGGVVCGECASLYYVTCATCAVLFPQDENRGGEGAALCPECFARPAAAGESLGEAEVESLVAEYLALHAEEKKISERLERIKEQLKAAASAKQRAAGAVVLRAGDAAVKCSYRAQLKLRPEAAPELERALGAEAFAALVERKVSYSPVRAAVEELLNSTDDGRAHLRDLLRDAVEVTETATITVVAPKGK